MHMNTGDTAFVMISAAMVLFMTPGLAFFYGGLGRRKNVINNMLSSLALMGLASVLWILIGYSLSFSGDFHGLIGDLSNFALNKIGMGSSPYAEGLPATTFVIFQMMFA